MRLSTDKADQEAYDLWWELSRLGRIRVFLDGEEIDCVMADDVRGTVTVANWEAEGELGNPELVHRTGAVRIEVDYYRRA